MAGSTTLSFRSVLLAFFLSLFNVVRAQLDIAAPRVPGAYIAELEDSENSDSFLRGMPSNGPTVSRRLDLDYTLFKGISFTIEDSADEEADARRIEAMPAVKQLWPIRLFPIPDDEVVWVGTDADADDISSAPLRRRQSGNETVDDFSPHVMTQIDQLRAEGIIGDGLRVAVIDTGVDYNHPALGNGCFGEGCLVAFGTDLVGDAYTGSEIPVPDDDPMDCGGHGTHVSGTVAAQMNPYNFTGAAPGVTLGHYKVFGCDGSSGTDVLIAAFNMAYEAGADIITASIGGASGWSEDPWAVAVQRIVEAGTPCTVSAGNSGDQSLFYASTAANGKGVTAIASVDNTESPAVLTEASYSTGSNSTGGSTEQSFGWTAGTPDAWGNVTLPVFAASYDTDAEADGCEPYPEDTPDLSGYIVLVRRGSCTFVQKAQNAVDAGARYVMLYNNAAGVTAPSAPDVEGLQAIGMMTADDGEDIIDILADGTEVTMDIVDPEVAPTVFSTTENNKTGGFMSTFTSWGPLYELDVYPQLASPGGNILSTYPLALGGYAVLSGTSMAAPLAAGVFALIAEVRGTLDPATLEAVLASTGAPVKFNDGSETFDYLAPVAQQGGGLIQAYDAAFAATILSTSSLAFNDTANLEPTLNFTVRNTGSEELTYTLSNIGAATGYTFASAEENSVVAFPPELVAASAALEFSEKEVSIAGGSEATIEVTVTPPSDLDEGRLPVYSGYIALNASDGESHSLPYQGIIGSMNDQEILDPQRTYLTQTSNEDYAPVPANTTFILPSGDSNSTEDAVYPQLAATLFLGSRILRADVVSLNGGSSGNGTIGTIFGFPSYYEPRGTAIRTWDGMLGDGTMAPAGSYALLVQALRIFGDPEDEEQYDSALTVPFNIRYS